MDLKLHIFEPPADRERPLPAAVFFFGGGWVGGSPSQFYHHCKYLSGQGVLAISAEYRTKNNGKAEPSECVKDGKAAIRYVREHAKELGVDPQRIAAGGGSAGGHVAAATGTVKGFEHDDQNMSVSSRPNAMLLFNPVYDNSEEGYGYKRVKAYWKEFSPRHNISKETPPAIVFFGSNEKLVKMPVARAIKQEMEALGVKSELKIYEGQGHGFFNYGRAGNKWFKATIVETHRFLCDLGWIVGEPAVDEYLNKKKVAAAGDRVALFNGKNMDGWSVIKCEAGVRKGSMLIKSGNGLVQSEKMYADFILELDWKKLAEDKWDSGIYFRYDSVPGNRPWPPRYQANLRKGMEGNCQSLRTSSTGLINPDDWNKFKLTVKGSSVELEINGKQAWKSDKLAGPDKGYIAIQAEVPHGGQHLFRNIYITEL